ncbi:MAG: DNA-binding protein [Hyphomicrobiales bacterium]|nr:MAG: DNA-binding protein [Hyphomicrobiales bacterium]
MNRADLLAALASARATVSALEQALAELDGVTAIPPARRPDPDIYVDTSVAMKMAKVSHSTITRWSRRYGIGHQLPSRQWRVSRRALLAFLEARDRGEIDEIGDVPRVPMATFFDEA